MTTLSPEISLGASAVDERALRRDLAALYRLVALYRWDDLIFTHISARLGDTEEFLLNPFGIGFDEMTASSLVKIDADGEPVGESDYRVNRAGFVIHSAVHLARPDVRCVIHLHSNDGVAVSAMEEGLLPLNQKVLGILADVAYHDYEGVSLDLAERERLAADLGSKHIMMLRNHGTLVAGTSVPEAFMRTYFLETSCTAQVRTLGMGRPLRAVDPDVQAGAADKIGPENWARMGREAWPTLLRKLDRLSPGYDA